MNMIAIPGGLNAPEKYDITDLALVKQSSLDKPVLDKSNLVVSNYRKMVRFLDGGKLHNGLSINELFVYDYSVLSRLVHTQPSNIKKVYVGVGSYDIPNEIQLDIKSLVEKRNVIVEIVNLNIKIISTNGHIMSSIETKSNDSKDWEILVMAENHDLYTNHVSFVNNISRVSLFAPYGTPDFKNNLDMRISNDINKETSRYLKYLESARLYKKHCSQINMQPSDELGYLGDYL